MSAICLDSHTAPTDTSGGRGIHSQPTLLIFRSQPSRSSYSPPSPMLASYLSMWDYRPPPAPLFLDLASFLCREHTHAQLIIGASKGFFALGFTLWGKKIASCVGIGVIHLYKDLLKVKKSESV
ncbi:hypothetical protein C4D60_Mb09t13460 [Musa balbisiana]|uniref:Uncharacterized protein n=1 Tax=Musa balbisiana TaxID=52838 RepID=A0A4S8IHH6_MUSBA|nr:hypothetical protein C4D60_Mb09t13460 [Musa balbisiana]